MRRSQGVELREQPAKDWKQFKYRNPDPDPFIQLGRGPSAIVNRWRGCIMDRIRWLCWLLNGMVFQGAVTVDCVHRFNNGTTQSCVRHSRMRFAPQVAGAIPLVKAGVHVFSTIAPSVKRRNWREI